MEAMKNEHPIAALAEALEVSRSGFFAHRQKAAGQRRQEDGELSAAIGPIFGASRQTYGCPRVTAALRQGGQRCGKNRVARLMREKGLGPSRSANAGDPPRPTATTGNPWPRTGWPKCPRRTSPTRCG